MVQRLAPGVLRQPQVTTSRSYPTFSQLPDRSRVAGLTIVVEDLQAAGDAWAALLDQTGAPVEPAEMEEAGLARAFDLGWCRLQLFEPAEHTDAITFLRARGPGLYAVTWRSDTQ